MRFNLVWLVIVIALGTPALNGQSTADLLSGRWSGNWGPTPSHRHTVILELKWDGKNLKGTINPGPNSYRLQKTSFDPSTGTIHMEVDAGSMSRRFHYIIEAKVEDGVLFGTWHHTNLQGDFRLARK